MCWGKLELWTLQDTGPPGSSLMTPGLKFQLFNLSKIDAGLRIWCYRKTTKTEFEQYIGVDLVLTEMPLVFDFHVYFAIFALHNTDALLSSQLNRHPLQEDVFFFSYLGEAIKALSHSLPLLTTIHIIFPPSRSFSKYGCVFTLKTQVWSHCKKEEELNWRLLSQSQ